MRDFLNLLGGLIALSAGIIAIIFFMLVVIKSAMWMWAVIF